MLIDLFLATILLTLIGFLAVFLVIYALENRKIYVLQYLTSKNLLNRQRIATLYAIIFIIFIGFFVFANNVSNPFIIDDNTYIVSNPSIHQVNFFEPFSSTTNLFNAQGQYRPLAALYFSLLYSMFTTNPLYYHVSSIVIHILNAILFFFLLKQFLKKTLSLFLSLTFLVHPLQVEAVSYIASADYLLLFFFGIAAFTLSLKNQLSWKRSITIGILLLCSLLANEAAVIFLLVILLYRIMFHRKQWTPLLVSNIIALTPYAYLRFIVARIHGFANTGGGVSEISRAPFTIRILNIPAELFYYIKNFFYPSHLAFEQEWLITKADFPHFYFPLVIDALFFLSLFLFGWFVFKANKKEFPVYLLFLTWLIAGLGIYSNIIRLDMIVADRWMYLPLVGLLGVIGVIIHTLQLITKQRNAVLLVLGILAISSLSIRTIVRNRDWSSEMGILVHDLPYYDNIASQEGVFGKIK
jgi:protein O-mannosyl-transferase